MWDKVGQCAITWVNTGWVSVGQGGSVCDNVGQYRVGQCAITWVNTGWVSCDNVGPVQDGSLWVTWVNAR